MWRMEEVTRVMLSHLVMCPEQHFAVGVDLLHSGEGSEEGVVQLLLPQGRDFVRRQLASDHG